MIIVYPGISAKYPGKVHIQGSHPRGLVGMNRGRGHVRTMYFPLFLTTACMQLDRYGTFEQNVQGTLICHLRRYVLIELLSIFKSEPTAPLSAGEQQNEYPLCTGSKTSRDVYATRKMMWSVH
jgi:hypothetical protein